jgi:hypothetical protein
MDRGRGEVARCLSFHSSAVKRITDANVNPTAVLFFLVVATTLWVVPRKFALAPLLTGCCFMTTGQGLELGSISLPVYRLLLLVGILRVVIKREGLTGGINLIDKIMIVWSCWGVFASLFHDAALGSGPLYALGGAFNILSVYFLTRVWVSSVEEMYDLVKLLPLILLPISLEMVSEKFTGRNLFSALGGVPEYVLLREGKFRAQGPFLHPILAGTVGACCVPLFIGILGSARNRAILGIAVGLCMVIASSSSGPVMSLLAGLFSVGIWGVRDYTRAMRICAVAFYGLLMLVMKQPPYYIISMIDISGGSTGWHRSFLIERTMMFLSEWWLFGTDHTRHWMPDQGTAMSPTHTDITNYYIAFAVAGGLLSVLLLFYILWVSFKWVGECYRSMDDYEPGSGFSVWCFGAALFAHVVTSISVCYFDQSVIFFWLNIAVIGSVYNAQSLQEQAGEDAESFDERMPAS